eukprot:NODE_123_length_18841_cov_0.279693.p3 type:complete len:521 gc:universal NODE_123_length_18841_cov_0.279693:5974-4412(-)
MRRPSTFDIPNSKKVKLNDYLSQSKSPLVDQVDLTRLITMQLHNMGFNKAAHQLEADSGIPMESHNISLLRTAVLKGEWQSVYSLLSILDFQNDLDIRQVCYKQDLLEMILIGRRMDALAFLRTISPILLDDKIKSFSKLIMSSDDDILDKYQNVQDRRQSVLLNLEDLIPTSLMIPHRRLEELILQSFEFQKLQCLYHNNSNEYSLFNNHKCSSDLFPRNVICSINAHSSEIWSINWNSAGDCLASGGKDNIVKLWSVSGSCIAQLKAHSSSITKIKFSPNNLFLLSGSSDSHVKLWDLSNFQCISSIESHKGDITGIEWTNDSLNFITSSTNSPLVIWDLNGKMIHKWNIPRITSIAKDPSSTLLCAVSGEKTIHVLNLNDKLQVRVFKESIPIVDIACSLLNPDLLITFHSNEIKIKNILTGKINGKYTGHNHGKFVVQGSFGGANDCYVATGSTDGKIYIWSRINEELIQVLDHHFNSPVACVSWNPVNNDLFASAADDGKICIWGLGNHTISTCD